MPRYFLELSYKGTVYSGFQVQDNAHTIQGEVENALATFFRERVELTGSSRTDAGVHALQNFFHFDTCLEINSKQIYNLNALLPQDISIKGIYPVPEGAHCRFDAVSREYRYFVYRQKNPFLADRGWMYPYPVNLGFLQESAELIMEYNDFTSFSKRNTQVNNFICTILQSEWQFQGDGVWVYTVKANRFLRGMVRGLVGTMLSLGRQHSEISEFRKVIERQDCSLADFTTPARGLFLHQVYFKENLHPFLPNSPSSVQA